MKKDLDDKQKQNKADQKDTTQEKGEEQGIKCTKAIQKVPEDPKMTADNADNVNPNPQSAEDQ